MRTIFKISTLALVLAVSGLFAQTATPSTTLCAAVKATDTSVCLAAVTSIVNQTGLYVDQELMLVQLSNSQVLTGTNQYVPVSRANRAGAGPPQAHATSSIVWLALTPGASKVQGTNGFAYATQLGDVGTCIRSAEIYLPHIWPDRAVKRDCNVGGTLASGQIGVWVDYAPASGLDQTSPTATLVLPASGALSIASGDYFVTKAGVSALTLAAPVSGVQDGIVIKITNTTANAHTLTATTLLENGASGSPYTTATFGAFLGSSITLRAYAGVWYVVSVSNVTLS